MRVLLSRGQHNRHRASTICQYLGCCCCPRLFHGPRNLISLAHMPQISANFVWKIPDVRTSRSSHKHAPKSMGEISVSLLREVSQRRALSLLLISARAHAMGGSQVFVYRGERKGWSLAECLLLNPATAYDTVKAIG